MEGEVNFHGDQRHKEIPVGIRRLGRRLTIIGSTRAIASRKRITIELIKHLNSRRRVPKGD